MVDCYLMDPFGLLCPFGDLLCDMVLEVVLICGGNRWRGVVGLGVACFCCRFMWFRCNGFNPVFR